MIGRAQPISGSKMAKVELRTGVQFVSSPRKAARMLSLEIEREEDGRWIGAVPELPGVLAHGATEADARAKVIALALRVIADRIENGEPAPFDARNLFAPAA